MLGKRQILIVAVIVAATISSLNLVVGTRDVPMTVNAAYRSVEGVIDRKDWVESPVQTLHTFLGGAVFPNIGSTSSGQFDFVDRLRLSYGDEAIVESDIVDVRDIFSRDDQLEFRAQLATWGYGSQRPCPHNADLLCEVYVAWNRERTKEDGIRMLSIRFGELEYAIVDDSVLDEG